MKIDLTRDIGEFRAPARNRINRAAAVARVEILTPGVPYAQKLAEARAGAGPLLEAEARIRGMTTAELAEQIQARASECMEQIVQLETRRQTALQAIDSAATPAEIDAIRL